MRYEKESLLSSVFSCWQAVPYNDTARRLSSLGLPPRHLHRGILPIPGSSPSRNRTWVTHCPRGRPTLGIYKPCRLPLCISVPHSSRLGRALRERKHLSLRRGGAPHPLAGVYHDFPTPLYFVL